MALINRRFALAGGSPYFVEPLHVGRPNQPDRDIFIGRVHEMLDRNWLANGGPFAREFEERLCSFTGTSGCVVVTNATVGLQSVIKAAGIRDAVAMPSFTFAATAAAACWVGLDPALFDIEDRRYGLDPAIVRANAENPLGAILGVHVWGLPCDVDGLQAVATERGIPLMFDAAHALGSTLNGKPIGGFGTAEVFSFHATKVMHSFEGGAITSNDDGLIDELRKVINFGFVGYDDVRAAGTNAKMSEVAAAMGISMLEQLPTILSRNHENREAYDEWVGSIPGITLVAAQPDSTTNDHYVIALVDEDAYGMSRDDLYRFLHSEGVLARRYFHPGIHDMVPFSGFGGRRVFPRTNDLAGRCLALPTGQAVDATTIEGIGGLVALGHDNAVQLTGLLDGVAWP